MVVTFYFLSFPWTLLSIRYPQSVGLTFLPLSMFFLLQFLLCFDFLKLYLEKMINIGVVGNVQGKVFFTFSWASLVWPFCPVFWGNSELFGVPNFGQKRQKNVCFFKLANFPFWLILKSPHKTTYVINRISWAFVLIWDLQKVGIWIIFLAVFRYHSGKSKI